MSLDLNELRELLAAIDQTDIAELTLKSADFELTLRRGVRIDERLYAADAVQLQTTAMNSVVPTQAKSAQETEPATGSMTAAIASQPSKSASPTTEPLRDNKLERRLVEVNSPMVGTFYRAAAPDEPPFVEVGDRIRKGQTICIIEAMKLMNELEAEIAGEVIEVLVQNGEPIEYGQLLMRINPD